MRTRAMLVCCAGLTLHCGDDGAGSGGAGGAGGGGTSAQTSTTSTSSTTAMTTGAGAGDPCPAGVTCVESFPFHDERDTSTEGTTAIASYDCAPNTNEGGPEILYRVAVQAPGYLSVAVYDAAGDDLDVHILSDLDPAAPSGVFCMSRGDVQAGADVNPGYLWVVADTWVNGSGTALSGPYQLDIGFTPRSEGPCDMEAGSMPRVGDGGDALAMPATGTLATAPHYVTSAEPPPFPTSASDGLTAHYGVTQQDTGFVMARAASWSSGDFFGAGVGDPADLPVQHEAFLVTMAWTPAARPAPGTRMLVRDPAAPERAVVVAAGYADGPSDLGRVGAVSEEVHAFLGSTAASTLELGFASDQALPLGPRRCTP